MCALRECGCVRTSVCHGSGVYALAEMKRAKGASRARETRRAVEFAEHGTMQIRVSGMETFSARVAARSRSKRRIVTMIDSAVSTIFQTDPRPSVARSAAPSLLHAYT